LSPSRAPLEPLLRPSRASLEPLSSPSRAPLAPLSRPSRAPLEPLSSPSRAPLGPLSGPSRAPLAPLLRPLSRRRLRAQSRAAVPPRAACPHVRPIAPQHPSPPPRYAHRPAASARAPPQRTPAAPRGLLAPRARHVTGRISLPHRRVGGRRPIPPAAAAAVAAAAVAAGGVGGGGGLGPLGRRRGRGLAVVEGRRGRCGGGVGRGRRGVVRREEEPQRHPPQAPSRRYSRSRSRSRSRGGGGGDGGCVGMEVDRGLLKGAGGGGI
jgi:hypothetical protein